MAKTAIYFTDSAGFGGAEQVLLTLLAGLDRCRWQPVLVHHPHPGIAPLVERARRLGVEIWAVPPVEGRGRVSWLLSFVRDLKAKRPAVFHAHLYWTLACTYGLFAAVLARVPAVVATQHAFGEIGSRRSKMVQRLVFFGADRFIAVSHHMASQLRQACGFSDHKVQVIHNGIPLGPFHCKVSIPLRDSLTRKREIPVILSVGRLSKEKGHRYLLEAVAMAPKALFVLAGDGPERASLEAQARALGVADRVTFLGHRDDIPDLLASCDLFVLPSLFEGFSLSILEAMAAGRPVIASAVGGADEVIVNGETGLLVPQADPPVLARAIRRVLSDPALAQQLAAAGKARVHREFSAETMVQRTTRVYDELLSAGSMSKNSKGYAGKI